MLAVLAWNERRLQVKVVCRIELVMEGDCLRRLEVENISSEKLMRTVKDGGVWWGRISASIHQSLSRTFAGPREFLARKLPGAREF